MSPHWLHYPCSNDYQWYANYSNWYIRVNYQTFVQDSVYQLKQAKNRLAERIPWLLRLLQKALLLWHILSVHLCIKRY
jgi:L-amino acid N-acyltransferase YncA